MTRFHWSAVQPVVPPLEENHVVGRRKLPEPSRKLFGSWFTSSLIQVAAVALDALVDLFHLLLISLPTPKG